MNDFQTRRRLREKRETKPAPSEPRTRGPWWNAALILAVVVVLVLGFAFVQRMFIAPPINAEREGEEVAGHRGAKIQVNVLNSVTGPRVARRTMDYLRARGFDVVEIGNAPAALSRSVVIDRVNDSVSARKVAFAMGIGDSCIHTEVNRDLYLDVTVILGEDYERLKPFK